MATVLGGATIEELRQGVQGTVIAPGDASYDEAQPCGTG
jgi:hypothetical protein